MIMGLFKKRGPDASSVRSVYERIVAAARRPVFYAEWGVPDTVEGRFEMITLHGFLAIDALAKTDPDFAQALADELFRDMDRSLREMGASDAAVPKKVRKMAEAFYGRAAAYRQALESGQAGALDAALKRNALDGADDAAVAAMARYVAGEAGRLAGQSPLSLAFTEPRP